MKKKMNSKNDYEEYINFINSINIKRENLIGIVAILMGLAMFFMKNSIISSLLFAIRDSKINFFGNFSHK